MDSTKGLRQINFCHNSVFIKKVMHLTKKDNAGRPGFSQSNPIGHISMTNCVKSCPTNIERITLTQILEICLLVMLKGKKRGKGVFLCQSLIVTGFGRGGGFLSTLC